MDPLYYGLGAGFTTVCVALAVASLIAMRREEMIVVVRVLAFVVIGFGVLVAAVRLEELHGALVGPDPYERAAAQVRMTGAYAWSYWGGLASEVVVPQLFWIRKCRATAWIALVLSLVMLWQPGLELVAQLTG